MGRKSVSSTSPRPPSGAGATKGKKGGARAGVHSLLSTFGGAVLAALVGYLVGYFTKNDKTSPGETVRRLLSALTSSEPAPPRMATGPSLAGCAITELFADEPVHGMHLLCVQRTPTGLFATTFMDGRNASTTKDGPVTVSAPAEDFQALRAQLQEALGLLPEGRRDPRKGPRNNAPNTFQPWALYTPQGFAVESLLDLKEGANDVLLYEGGKFIWPGVREGHVTQVSSVDGLEAVSMRTLSMSPLVFSVEGFLTPSECRHIRDRAGPHMRQSGVALMDHDKGKEATDWRTSATYFMPSYGDAVLQSVDRRVADLTRQPEESQEDVQVLRYDHTQRYDTHHDFFDYRLYKNDPGTMHLIQNGRRNRMITVLWYLSDVVGGGETYFPYYGNRHLTTHSMKDCDSLEGGLRSPPREGRVIMFYSLLPNGDLDEKSLHGSCAIKDGIKWAANKWIWSDIA